MGEQKLWKSVHFGASRLVKDATIASQSDVYPLFLLIIQNYYMPFPLSLNVSVRSRETVGTKEVHFELKVSHVASQVCVSKFMVKRRKERKVVTGAKVERLSP